MKKLSKSDEERRAQYVLELRGAYETLSNAHSVVKLAIEEYNVLVMAFNDNLTKACDFAEDIVREMQDYEVDRSDGWRESDAGEDYADWITSWEQFASSADLEAMMIPDEVPDDDAIAELDDLPSMPGGN